jgi:chromate reductase, NAD(P)H dehydrogenase (quinone)
MEKKLKIFALSGSTRKKSANHQLILAIQELSADIFDLSLYEDLLSIPAFNPDDVDSEPAAVTDFKKKLGEADGILICTPEYAAGVSGALKNAIDWTVSGMEFYNKPVALITAATSGYLAHASLLGTLLIIQSKITTDSQLLIPMIKTKLNDENKITDSETLWDVQKLIDSLKDMILHPDTQTYLPAPVMK